jgi:hypothetical protein
MEKRKITAREVLADIRAGVDDTNLMKKYRLSAQGLQSVLNKMVQAGMVTEEELDERVPLSERTVDLGLFICPACGNIQGREFIECPRCGYVPPGQAKKSKTLRTSPGKPKTQSVSRSGAQREGRSVGGESFLSTGAREVEAASQASARMRASLRSIAKHCRVLGITALLAYFLVALALLAAMRFSVSQGWLTLPQSLLAALILGLPAIITGITIFVILRALAASMLILQKISDKAEDRGGDH